MLEPCVIVEKSLAIFQGLVKISRHFRQHLERYAKVVGIGMPRPSGSLVPSICDDLLQLLETHSQGVDLLAKLKILDIWESVARQTSVIVQIECRDLCCRRYATHPRLELD